jgi:hypothetical protein
MTCLEWITGCLVVLAALSGGILFFASTGRRVRRWPCRATDHRKQRGPASTNRDWNSAVRGEPSDVVTTGIVDRRLISGRRLAGGDPTSGIVIRDRAAAVGRRPADDLAAPIVERALLRRGCAGQQREPQQGEHSLGQVA